MENPIAELPAKVEQEMPELTAETRKVKKRKKRKREEEPNSVTVQREDVRCHLEPSGQDEDWCLGETWRINPNGSSERPKQQPQSSTEPKPSKTQEQIQPMLCDAPQNHHDSSVKKKKKKKKHKEKLNDNIKDETSERKAEMTRIDTESLDLSASKKKAKKRKREAHQREDEDAQGDNAGDESLSQTNHVVLEKACKPSTAAVVVWDSQVQDGYKHSRDTADPEQASRKESRPAAAAWDGKKSSSVVEELLKNATDKAYGTEVLSWDGERSAISRDAMQDTCDAKHDTVIDEWDEEFDSGKVKKVKTFKKERRSVNVFQKIQDRRNMWSVTPGGRRNSWGHRY
ncbi:hypothetical protein QTP86_012153 [Hemibagrus guttatus]|nr:hypothetical protein QTP86_012153 [Hemibagrus guttatus]